MHTFGGCIHLKLRTFFDSKKKKIITVFSCSIKFNISLNVGIGNSKLSRS